MDAWEEGVPATALREISALKQMNHPNIVKVRYVSRPFHYLEAVAVAPDYRPIPPRPPAANRRLGLLSGNLYLVFELLDLDMKALLDPVRDRGLGVDLVRHYLFHLLLVRGKSLEPAASVQLGCWARGTRH